jgi:hypothetical protein
MSRETVFTDIFTEEKWGGGETISGEGSTLENTKGIREQLPEFLRSLGINSIVDAPCGDYHWFNNTSIEVASYIGVDIVKPLIDSNNEKYRGTSRFFLQMDLCEDVVPKCDLILCRDGLLHLSDKDGLKALKNFKASGSKYLLITTSPENPYNHNIETGGFRHLNMTKGPFNFPEPITMVNEQYMQYNGMFKDKSLGLWDLQKLCIDNV